MKIFFVGFVFSLVTCFSANSAFAESPAETLRRSFEVARLPTAENIFGHDPEEGEAVTWSGYYATTVFHTPGTEPFRVKFIFRGGEIMLNSRDGEVPLFFDGDRTALTLDKSALAFRIRLGAGGQSSRLLFEKSGRDEGFGFVPRSVVYEHLYAFFYGELRRD